MRKVALVPSLVASVAVLARAQTTRQAELRVESNVVYGMYSEVDFDDGVEKVK
jgi:hypothetical protein